MPMQSRMRCVAHTTRNQVLSGLASNVYQSLVISPHGWDLRQYVRVQGAWRAAMA